MLGPKNERPTCQAHACATESVVKALLSKKKSSLPSSVLVCNETLQLFGHPVHTYMHERDKGKERARKGVRVCVCVCVCAC